MDATVKKLSAGEIATARAQAASSIGPVEAVVQPGQFVFFAAFDGTNNDKNDLSKSGDPMIRIKGARLAGLKGPGSN